MKKYFLNQSQLIKLSYCLVLFLLLSPSVGISGSEGGTNGSGGGKKVNNSCNDYTYPVRAVINFTFPSSYSGRTCPIPEPFSNSSVAYGDNSYSLNQS